MKKPLLIVLDDEPDITQMIADFAELLEFEVKTSNSSEHFIHLLEAEPANIIISDIVMPDLDGMEIIHELSKRKISSPLVFMSGYDKSYLKTAGVLAKGNRLNLMGTLCKPFAMGELEELLKKVVDSA